MNPQRQLLITGGACGIAGTLCYMAAITVDIPDPAAYALVMAWPVLSIIFLFSLYRFLSLTAEGLLHHLAFVFGALGFTIVAAMISVQLSVRFGMGEMLEAAGREEMVDTLKRSLRLVDMGLDVAWDIFIGVSLIFLGAAIGKHRDFGVWWGGLSGALGLALIVLNTITFPFPPDTRGLFDVGPAIGLYIIILAGRVLSLGMKTATAAAS